MQLTLSSELTCVVCIRHTLFLFVLASKKTHFLIFCLSADIDDHFDVVSELNDVAHLWRSLGGALRLRPPDLARIEKERPNDTKSCLSEMVTEWLNQSYNTQRFGLPSWKMLVEAVAHRNGGNNQALATIIANKYNGQSVRGVTIVEILRQV